MFCSRSSPVRRPACSLGRALFGVALVVTAGCDQGLGQLHESFDCTVEAAELTGDGEPFSSVIPLVDEESGCLWLAGAWVDDVENALYHPPLALVRLALDGVILRLYLMLPGLGPEAELDVAAAPPAERDRLWAEAPPGTAWARFGSTGHTADRFAPTPADPFGTPDPGNRVLIEDAVWSFGEGPEGHARLGLDRVHLVGTENGAAFADPELDLDGELVLSWR